jgi:hypothetical protein
MGVTGFPVTPIFNLMLRANKNIPISKRLLHFFKNGGSGQRPEASKIPTKSL